MLVFDGLRKIPNNLVQIRFELILRWRSTVVLILESLFCYRLPTRSAMASEKCCNYLGDLRSDLDRSPNSKQFRSGDWYEADRDL